jgi:hypothetical protein
MILAREYVFRLGYFSGFFAFVTIFLLVESDYFLFICFLRVD